jgi:hypothetical protein
VPRYRRRLWPGLRAASCCMVCGMPSKRFTCLGGFALPRSTAFMQFLLPASELRTRAEEILVRAANTNDREVQEMMRVVAAGYEKLARLAEQRVREADKA